MKIAIVGSGVSGLTVAWLLHGGHEITVFEANDYVGGHTHTHDVEMDGSPFAVDTGFIVFNDWTYPNFIRLLDRLGVASQPSEMSFSVRSEAEDFEYCGSSMNSLFAQRSNLFRPSFHRMLRDILRFNRASPELLERGEDDATTLGEYLRSGGYSDMFIERYIVPMGAAIWSAEPERMRDFPARYFVQFFKNHGLLSVNNRPQWRVITGGSRRYVEKMIAPFRDRIRLKTPIESISRGAEGVLVTPRGGEAERFDEIVLAAHSDQALRMLADPSDREREILGAIGYQGNETVLHTDVSLLPRRRLAWASWNYHLVPGRSGGAAVTYNMNILQSLKTSTPFCVTLNRPEAIAKEKILRSNLYHHPVFTPGAVAAQGRWAEISGVNRTHYCGAYWGYGFHEDGVKSALAVAARFGEGL